MSMKITHFVWRTVTWYVLSYKKVRFLHEWTYENHQQSGEPKMNTISRFNRKACSHILGHQLRFGQWRAKDRGHQHAWDTARHSSHSLSGEQRTGIIISRLETQQRTAGTHSLESRGQASSASLIHSKIQQALTLWRSEDRHHQQARNTARHSSYSLPGEQRTGIISRLETLQGTAATHSLENKVQASSAGLKQ